MSGACGKLNEAGPWGCALKKQNIDRQELRIQERQLRVNQTGVSVRGWTGHTHASVQEGIWNHFLLPRASVSTGCST